MFHPNKIRKILNWTPLIGVQKKKVKRERPPVTLKQPEVSLWQKGANPNVERVTPRTVVFKPSFIEHALCQYLYAGKGRVEIFREAGIDVDALGKERLNMAFGNWLTKHKRGIPIGMPPGRKKKEDRRSYVERLEDELARAKELLELYRQIARLDRRHQPQKQPPKDSKE